MPTIVGVPASGGQTGARRSWTWQTEMKICHCVADQSQAPYPFSTQK